MHGNSSMHYVALIDDEDLIEAVINKVNWAPHVCIQLKDLSEEINKLGRSPLDHFFVGKSDSFEMLHNFLSELPINKDGMGSPQNFSISQIKK